MTVISVDCYEPKPAGPLTIISDHPDSKRLLHIGVHNSANRNAGDTLLFPVVRRTFEELLGPCSWELKQAWEQFTVDDANDANRRFDGIVIGGGGLLLRDQLGSDASTSGWQWNCPIEALQAVQIPIIVFAIGYNRFRNQDDFDPIFTTHLRLLAKKSAFFGLRNSGSVAAVTNYLLPGQSKFLSHQYCPTTVLWQLYPEYRKLAQAHDEKNRRVLSFNAAFDRVEMRFGQNPKTILKQVAKAVSVAKDRGWEIVVTAHKTMDREIEPFLDATGVDYEVVDLTNASPHEIIKFYAKIDFAFGMRGHAQMIPFGLHRPIFSIVSHDKMAFFLHDIGHPEWGVEASSSELLPRLEAALSAVEVNRTAIHKEVARVQQRAWEETISNMSIVDSAL